MFHTVTCNPTWTEIVDELQPGQDAWMRPDITARVFKMKLDAIMEDLMKNGFMGRAVAHIQVTEFQKRGLPHAHLVITLAKDDVPTVDMYDNFVCAERPTLGCMPSSLATCCMGLAITAASLTVENVRRTFQRGAVTPPLPQRDLIQSIDAAVCTLIPAPVQMELLQSKAIATSFPITST